MNFHLNWTILKSLKMQFPKLHFGPGLFDLEKSKVNFSLFSRGPTKLQFLKSQFQMQVSYYHLKMSIYSL